MPEKDKKCWMCGRKISEFHNAMEVSFREMHFYVGAGCVFDFLSRETKNQLLADIWSMKIKKIER